MTNAARARSQKATERKIAASLIYEARLKDYEAAGWLDHGKNIDEARATAHSALDAVLDATLDQIKATKAEFLGGAS